MHSYEDYFSSDKITEVLLELRTRAAKVAHKKYFYSNLSVSSGKTPKSDLPPIFPPRRQWNRFRPKTRKQGNIELITLKNAVSWHSRSGSTISWFRRLTKVVEQIQTEALSGKFSFSSPQITPQLKSGNEYRAISSFPELTDRVIDIINAKYLRELVDPALEPASVAFRVEGNKYDRNSAITGILNFREESHDKNLFVAECDIRGFFDCVHHSVAKEALSRGIMLRNLRMDQSLKPDPRAIAIFSSYLAAFSFPKNVKKEAEPKLRRKEKNEAAIFKWPERGAVDDPSCLRYFHNRPRNARIGIPQGGSHSCLIANLVLDLADKEVLLSLKSNTANANYYRYCDDMIILSTSQSHCEQAYEAYIRALRFLKLPYHPSFLPEFHEKRFFTKSKTKAPYRWAKANKPKQFPWIQFLGYQVRYDGLIRVRPSSLHKQKLKIRTLTETIGKSLRNSKMRVSRKRIYYRFNSKIAAFSVGNVEIHKPEQSTPRPMSWCSGFKLLKNRRHIKKQLADLDRAVTNRRAHLKRILNKKVSGAKSQKQAVKRPVYFGRRLSHGGQFD